MNEAFEKARQKIAHELAVIIAIHKLTGQPFNRLLGNWAVEDSDKKEPL